MIGLPNFTRRLVYGPGLFLIGITFAFAAYDQAAGMAQEAVAPHLLSKETIDLIAEILVSLAGIGGSTWTAMSTLVQKREKFARAGIEGRVRKLEEWRVHDRENVIDRIAQSERRVMVEIQKSQDHAEDFFRKGIEDIKYLITEQGAAQKRREERG